MHKTHHKQNTPHRHIHSLHTTHKKRTTQTHTHNTHHTENTPHTKHTTYKTHHTQNHTHTPQTRYIHSYTHTHHTHTHPTTHAHTHTHTPGQGMKNQSRCVGFSNNSGVKQRLLPKVPREKVAFGHIKWVPSSLEMVSQRARPRALPAVRAHTSQSVSGRARPTPLRHPLRSSSTPSQKALPGQLAAPTPAPRVPQDGPDVCTAVPEGPPLPVV